MIQIYCDGLCEPRNPGGYATWGWTAAENGEEIATGKGCVGHGPGMTNNLAEYTAVIEALIWAYKHGHTGCTLYTDSKLVVEQSNGRWQCNAANLIPLRARIVNGLDCLSASLAWVPREQNTRADALSREAYRDAKKGEKPPWLTIHNPFGSISLRLCAKRSSVLPTRKT